MNNSETRSSRYYRAALLNYVAWIMSDLPDSSYDELDTVEEIKQLRRDNNEYNEHIAQIALKAICVDVYASDPTDQTMIEWLEQVPKFN